MCEMCGSSTNLVTAEVEGSQMKVCQGCAKYGTVQKSVHRSTWKPRKSDQPEMRVVRNYAQLIRTARERKGMSQEDFAKSLQEKESVIQKWESGTMKPRLNIARQLGKLLNVRLLENDEKKAFVQEKKKVASELTLGDFIKVRKRK